MEKPYAVKIAERPLEETCKIAQEGLNYYANKISSVLGECYNVGNTLVLAALKIVSTGFEQQLSEKEREVAQSIIDNTACFAISRSKTDN